MKCYPFNPKITKKDLEQGQAVSNAFWNACSMALINEKENKMAKAKYDVGDILTWCNDGDCYATAVIVRWHTKSIFVEGISLEQHTDYDVFVKSHEKDDFELAHGVPECAFYNYKVVGHIDISGMPNDEVKAHLDYAIAHEFCEKRIPYVILAYWDIMKMNEKNCCCDGRDKLEEENKLVKKYLGSANDRIFELNKEIDRLRDSCRNDRFRITANLRKIGFTSETIRSIIETDMV